MAFITPVITPFHSHRLPQTSSRQPSFFRPSTGVRQMTRCTATEGPRVDAKPSAEAREARVQLWQEVEALKKSLEIAVNAERFADAARIRDKIESLSLADDYFRTEKQLQKAVEEERFAEAARLRDVLQMLDPPPGMDVLRGETWSETRTDGIFVRVESYYMPEQSVPEQKRYLFGYKVKIENEGKDTCQLVSRHWIIQQRGGESEVKGPGVVGRQPVLEPGDKFEYTSACPIEGGEAGIVGSMRGRYWFCKGDVGNVKYEVKIDPFYFRLPDGHY